MEKAADMSLRPEQRGNARNWLLRHNITPPNLGSAARGRGTGTIRGGNGRGGPMRGRDMLRDRHDYQGHGGRGGSYQQQNFQRESRPTQRGGGWGGRGVSYSGRGRGYFEDPHNENYQADGSEGAVGGDMPGQYGGRGGYAYNPRGGRGYRGRERSMVRNEAGDLVHRLEEVRDIVSSALENVGNIGK